jgi:hypothetical protein
VTQRRNTPFPTAVTAALTSWFPSLLASVRWSEEAEIKLPVRNASIVMNHNIRKRRACRNAVAEFVFQPWSGRTHLRNQVALTPLTILIVKKRSLLDGLEEGYIQIRQKQKHEPAIIAFLMKLFFSCPQWYAYSLQSRPKHNALKPWRIVLFV